MIRFLLIIAAIVTFLGNLNAADRPNIVWIVSEDNSKHYLKLFDEAGVEAPHIEALARDGLVFEHAFSNGAVCSVARTTLATGCYAPRIGTAFHRKSKLAHLPENFELFPHYLKEAGYYTTNNSKKDYNAIEGDGTWDDSSGKADWRNREDKTQPFFHMQSHSESHEGKLHFSGESFATEKTLNDPDKVTLPDYFPDTELFRYTYASYLDKMLTIDEIVGKTIAKLEEDGVLEDTFVFYFGDHGGVLPRSKGYIYESGLHVPLVIRVPEKWKHLVDAERGTRQKGFVSFVDFAPTALKLAGVPIPQQMDGRPFLGEGVSMEEVNKQDSTFGHADRFDEKYDLCRSLRVGDWKYIRNYQPYLPDGLQNNYRYFMLAYREWRDLYNEGKLGSDQRQFFEPKAPEMLFDLSTDPHEVNNLAGDPAHQARLSQMREQLRKKLVAMPDLGFYPEDKLYAEAMEDPVAYGRSRKEEIGVMIRTADLMLRPYSDVYEDIQAALTSENAGERYWAATVCAAFGEEASDLARLAKPLLEDESTAVRVRAAEFLGLTGEIDPRATLIDVVNHADNEVTQLIALNAAALFHDHSRLSYPFDASNFENVKGEAQRRIDYFTGDWLKPKPAGKKKGQKGQKAKKE
ncbi:MAG: sulfatase-like hydrolase/transferase [Verrucomicrobiales bacterium]|nr:sulfatase-like hydrolase/transferase [Verrucomicrobiales bacterium]